MTTPTYTVTAQGLDQIRHWLLHEWDLPAEAADTLDAAVRAYAVAAEASADGELKMQAWETASGRPAYLRPERKAVLKDYTYRTDRESGVIEAATFEDACARLDALVPASARADGGWGWVDDCDLCWPRYPAGGWW